MPQIYPTNSLCSAVSRDCLAIPDRGPRVPRLPAYSPDCSPDEASRAWAREAVPANTRLGTKAAVRARHPQFFAGLATRMTEAQSHCHRKLQALAEALLVPSPESHREAHHVDPICASV